MINTKIKRTVRVWAFIGLSALVAIVVYMQVDDVPSARFSEEINAAAGEVERTGDPVRLASVTDFEWDEVAAFEKWTPIQQIDELMGNTELDEGIFWTEGMLVFRNNGRVVRCLKVNSYIHSEPMKRMGRKAAISPDPEGGIDPEFGHRSLLLIE